MNKYRIVKVRRISRHAKWGGGHCWVHPSTSHWTYRSVIVS